MDRAIHLPPTPDLAPRRLEEGEFSPDLVKQKENTFYVGDENEPSAELHYVPTGPDKLIVDHTYVSDELRGQGIGEKLVVAVVEYAREQGKTIIPLCPFTKNQFDRHPEYHDVLAN